MYGVNFGPGAQPYEYNNPVFDNSGNYQTVSQECCTEAAVGVPVSWFTQWGGQGWCITTDIQISNYDWRRTRKCKSKLCIWYYRMYDTSGNLITTPLPLFLVSTVVNWMLLAGAVVEMIMII